MTIWFTLICLLLTAQAQDRPILVALYTSRKSSKAQFLGSFETCSRVFIQPDIITFRNYSFTLVGKDQKKEVGNVTIIPSTDKGQESFLALCDSPYPVAVPLPSQGVAESFEKDSEPTTVESFSLPSFQDYMESNCEIDFCVAVDFTSSNGTLGRC